MPRSPVSHEQNLPLLTDARQQNSEVLDRVGHAAGSQESIDLRMLRSIEGLCMTRLVRGSILILKCVCTLPI